MFIHRESSENSAHLYGSESLNRFKKGEGNGSEIGAGTAVSLVVIALLWIMVAAYSPTPAAYGVAAGMTVLTLSLLCCASSSGEVI